MMQPFLFYISIEHLDKYFALSYNEIKELMR